MPYQLRRIIGINLRNPKSDLPSGRVAELDPRGGIVAAGENGVGKTTFLRLLPLFYGATPTQILRGTGLSSLIKHTLPDSSSAVAYEYERGDQDDLRCVVMHARPDMDAPQFHIVRGGFEERFFVDEEGNFVKREDFKARVEAMGLQVDRRLHLHEWRAVILNERLPTKEGAELRRLAAVHSLSPTTSLHGLDQIAASMANERLSFRDLQSIVLDRVIDAQAEDGPRQTTRELRQSREAVSGWLDAREHLLRLRERRADAVKLRELCGTVKDSHHQLCALHLAVKDVLQKIAEDKVRWEAKEIELRSGFERTKDELRRRIGILEENRAISRRAFEEVNETVEGTERRLKTFQKMDVEHMGQEQDREADLQAQRQGAEGELGSLTAAAGGIAHRYGVRIQQIRSAFESEKTRIADDQAGQARSSAAQLEEIRQAEASALDGLAAPGRLALLPAERDRASSELGALRFEAKSPAASAQTRAAVAAAQEQVKVARREKAEADVAADAAAKTAAAARQAHEGALARWMQDQGRTAQARQTLETIERQMTPPKGSLLEYLRGQPAEQWEGAAKVIAPDLLERADLAPSKAVTRQVDFSASVVIGPLQLDVSRVDAPEWVDMVDLRARHGSAKESLAAAEAQVAGAKREAERLQKAAEAAGADQARAVSHAGMAGQAVERADAGVDEIGRRAQQEIEARAAELKELIDKAQQRLRDLEGEQVTLQQQHQEARERIKTEFGGQRSRASADNRAVTDRLDQELTGATGRRDKELQDAAEDQRRDLEGAGVDPQRIEELTQRVQGLDTRLAAIARNRHHVDAWREFKAKDLAQLAVNREMRTQADAAWVEAKRQHGAALNELEALERRRADDLMAAQSARARLDQDQGKLRGLIDQGLGAYLGPAGTKLSREWTADELVAAVTQVRTQIFETTEDVINLRRTLRNLMTSVPGSVDDWVQQAEKQALQSEHMLPHEEASDKALLLCQWFETGYSQPVIALNNELRSYLDLAGNFVRSLEGFDRRIGSFNRELQSALENNIAHFERFRDLSVTIKSSVNQIGYLKVLREMQAQADSKVPLMRASPGANVHDFELPDDEVVGLIRSFREMLQREGGVHVNLADQVQLECSLMVDSKHVVVTNEDEFRARASNGNTALIMAMFLLGFAAMVRRKAPVRLTWVTDEIGRFDPKNLGAFLQTLDSNQIDVISAAPSADPAAIYLFKRRCIFENTGAIRTHQHRVEVAHVAH